MALEEARRKPIFSSRAPRSQDPSEIYPNVFDSMATARMTSSFIGGNKVLYSVCIDVIVSVLYKCIYQRLRAYLCDYVIMGCNSGQ